jgi:endonuclease III
MNYEALFEDEENIFGGTPQSKFWDIANQASSDLVKDQMDQFFEKYAIMEMLLMQTHGEDAIDDMIKSFGFEKSMEVENHKKSTYLSLTGEIVCRLDS